MEYILSTISWNNFVKVHQHMNECKKAMWPAKKPVNICTVNAVPCATITYSDPWQVSKQQEGINPMRSYNDTYASASISNPQSDVAQQREYLKGQLKSGMSPKRNEFEKTFNLHVDNSPKTFKDMIAAITGGKYTIDPKVEKLVNDDDFEHDFRFCGPLYGIIWDGPKADNDGYQKALTDLNKQYTIAERIIVTGDAAAGLAALEAFEAWQPTVATTTAN